MSQYVTIPTEPLKLNKLNIKCTYNNKNYNLVIGSNQVFLMDENTIVNLKSNSKFTGNNEFIILPIGQSSVLASVVGNPTNQQSLATSTTLINSVNNNFVTTGGNNSNALVTLIPTTTQDMFNLSFTLDKSLVTKDKDGKDVTTSTKKTYYVGITDQKPTNVTDDIKIYDFLCGYENMTDSHVLNFSVSLIQQNYMMYIVIIIILLILLCCCCCSFILTNK